MNQAISGSPTPRISRNEMRSRHQLGARPPIQIQELHEGERDPSCLGRQLDFLQVRLGADCDRHAAASY
jgi:hypothetical protein